MVSVISPIAATTVVGAVAAVADAAAVFAAVTSLPLDF